MDRCVICNKLIQKNEYKFDVWQSGLIVARLEYVHLFCLVKKVK